MFRCQQWAASQFGKMAFQSSSQTQVRYAVDMFHVDLIILAMLNVTSLIATHLTVEFVAEK